MKPITKQQRAAIKRVFDRCTVYKSGKTSDELAIEAGWKFIVKNDGSDGTPVVCYWTRYNMSTVFAESDDIVREMRLDEPMNYREFRKTVCHGYDCLMVKWAGMWLGIEADGYTHS